MFRNNLKIAVRNLLRHRSIAMINIFGLAIGIACCVLISLFIRDELSYDRYHKDADRIYRVVKDFVNDDGTKLPDATTCPAMGPAMLKEIPGVEHMARIMPGWGNKFYVRYGEKKFIEENVYRGDSNLFEVFTFPFIKGDPKTALKDPNTVVITESAAKKYFGSEDPMGKKLEIDTWEPRVVTGVIKDIPENSHFNFNILVDLRFRDDDGKPIDINSTWSWYNYYTYIKLKSGVNITDVDKKAREIFKKNRPNNKNYFYSQALTSIHLNSNLKWELQPNSDKIYIYIFATIGLFIILIACINYVNLTTARSSLRAKEIGVRKVSGAVRGSLTRQFLTESILVSIIAACVAMLIAQLFLPAINNITQKHLSLLNQNNFKLFLAVLSFAVFIGIVAGFYPALYLSSFKPVRVLKGEKNTGAKTLALRKVLVVTQFTLSITLIIGTFVVMKQINFVQNAKMGLDKSQVLNINDIGYLTRAERVALKIDLLKIPGVKMVASNDGIVGGQNWTTDFSLKGTNNDQLINFLSVDENFVKALGIQIIEGRDFSSAYPDDTVSNGIPGTTERNVGGVLLNETAVRDLKIPPPVVGKMLTYGTREDTTYYVEIIGVMKNFNFSSMKNEIKPFAFMSNPRRQGFFTVKLEGAAVPATLDRIQSAWNKNVKSRPFQYFFLDETYDKLYKAERNFKTVFLYITLIAIFIACLGLFGLAAFTAEQRTKEIGIRKVLGASVSNIVGLLSKDFLALVLFSVVIATPIAWYAMTKWLQDFAFRTNISWWIFIVAGIVALAIALLTVSFQAIKTAVANPVKSLRTE